MAILAPWFMKLFGEQIALPINVLINKSIGEGIMPDEIQIANIIPVYKPKATD